MVPTLVLLVLAGSFVALAWIGQRRLLYFPSQVVPTDVPHGVERAGLTTADGLDLVAWFVPATRTDGAWLPRGTVVAVLPGNGGNRVGRLPLARRLAAAGASVLLVDYRGYGGNPGRPTATGLARDTAAARRWVAARRDLDDTRVVLLGESLGTAVAVESAADDPPAALVLRSPFTSLADVAAHHYRVVPRWFLRDRWNTVDRIRDLDVPTLVVVGTGDRVVPPAQSRRVHAAAGPRGHLAEVADAGHDDPALVAGPSLVATVVAFLAEQLPP